MCEFDDNINLQIGIAIGEVHEEQDKADMLFIKSRVCSKLHSFQTIVALIVIWYVYYRWITFVKVKEFCLIGNGVNACIIK